MAKKIDFVKTDFVKTDLVINRVQNIDLYEQTDLSDNMNLTETIRFDFNPLLR